MIVCLFCDLLVLFDLTCKPFFCMGCSYVSIFGGAQILRSKVGLWYWSKFVRRASRPHRCSLPFLRAKDQQDLITPTLHSLTSPRLYQKPNMCYSHPTSNLPKPLTFRSPLQKTTRNHQKTSWHLSPKPKNLLEPDGGFQPLSLQRQRYPNPSTFSLERNASAVDSGAFGGGPRLCPGRFLATGGAKRLLKGVLGDGGFSWDTRIVFSWWFLGSSGVWWFVFFDFFGSLVNLVVWLCCFLTSWSLFVCDFLGVIGLLSVWVRLRLLFRANA